MIFEDPSGDRVKVDGGDGPCATALTSKNPAVGQNADMMLQQQDAMDANAQRGLYINSHNVVTTKPGWFAPGGGGYNPKGTSSSSSGGGSLLGGIVHHIAQYGRDVASARSLMSSTAAALTTDALHDAGEAWHETVGQHWRGILQAGGFTVCLVASAGACLLAGLGVAGAIYIGNGFGSHQWGRDDLHGLEVNAGWAFVGYFGARGLGTMIPEGGGAEAPSDLSLDCMIEIAPPPGPHRWREHLLQALDLPEAGEVRSSDDLPPALLRPVPELRCWPSFSPILHRTTMASPSRQRHEAAHNRTLSTARQPST